jgi:hypothetical protein
MAQEIDSRWKPKKVDRSGWRWMGGASRTEVESSTEDG